MGAWGRQHRGGGADREIRYKASGGEKRQGEHGTLGRGELAMGRSHGVRGMVADKGVHRGPGGFGDP